MDWVLLALAFLLGLSVGGGAVLVLCLRLVRRLASHDRPLRDELDEMIGL
jgi:uncharacterized membrane-anchored protein YhcB (DUF1043 family)